MSTDQHPHKPISHLSGRLFNQDLIVPTIAELHILDRVEYLTCRASIGGSVPSTFARLVHGVVNPSAFSKKYFQLVGPFVV
jgi:hypothetical protein